VSQARGYIFINTHHQVTLAHSHRGPQSVFLQKYSGHLPSLFLLHRAAAQSQESAALHQAERDINKSLRKSEEITYGYLVGILLYTYFLPINKLGAFWIQLPATHILAQSIFTLHGLYKHEVSTNENNN